MLNILLVLVLLKHYNMWKTEAAIKFLCRTVVLTISYESREVTCTFRKMLEKFSWTSSLLMQLLFRYFFKDFT